VARRRAANLRCWTTRLPSARRPYLQPRRDVDAVAINVAAIGDYVAEIDPDAKPQAALLGEIEIAVGHRALNFARTAHSVDHTRELRQHAVAGGLDDPPVMLADLRIDQFAQMRLEAFVRAFLIRTHQARIAHHIGGEDRGETAGGGHSSVTPALRNPVKKVVSARALVLGTPNDAVLLN